MQTFPIFFFSLFINKSRSLKFCLKALYKRAYIIFETRPWIKCVHSKYSNIRFPHLTLRGCTLLDYPPLHLKLLKNYQPHLTDLRFSDVFRGYRSETLVENGLIEKTGSLCKIISQQKTAMKISQQKLSWSKNWGNFCKDKLLPMIFQYFEKTNKNLPEFLLRK